MNKIGIIGAMELEVTTLRSLMEIENTVKKASLTFYEGKFREYEITHLLMGKNTKLNLLISRDDNYKLLYSDKNFVIYERLNANVEGEE